MDRKLNSFLKQLWLRAIEDATRVLVTQRKNVDPTDAKKSADPNRQSVWSNDSFVRVSKAANSSPNEASPATTTVIQPGKLPAYAVPPSSVPPEAARETLKALSATLPECAEMFSTVAEDDTPAPIRKNPFNDSSPATITIVTEQTDATGATTVPTTTSTRNPRDWLWAVPEDLDVAISERDFSRATELIVKAQRELDRILVSYDVHSTRQAARPTNNSTRPQPTGTSGSKGERGTEDTFMVDSKPRSAWEALSKRIANNQKSLAEALEQELITAAERHGAPRTIHAAVSHLGALGKSTLAAQLFLVYRSNVMSRALTRGVRQEGNQLVYLNRLSFAFHRNLAETAAEWQNNVVAPLISQQTITGASGEAKSNQLTEQLLALRKLGCGFSDYVKFDWCIMHFLIVTILQRYATMMDE
ncbi:unnamed protein product [Echinostoma caproni]|uniref:Exo84_C domain-containing protein n=1 Tax=Echinostoma caproni TaxID=27848 RepID=A0A183B502_9TREM|nr:unnamed protein product [Echinostoma caproni]